MKRIDDIKKVVQHRKEVQRIAKEKGLSFPFQHLGIFLIKKKQQSIGNLQDSQNLKSRLMLMILG